MIPNSWRPESRGYTVLGESGIDEVAGGAGTIGAITYLMGYNRGKKNKNKKKG